VPAHATAFHPAPGKFTSPQPVSLSTPTPGAIIHYTTDGTAPTERSPAFKGPILVERTTTIRAMAQVPGLPRSELSSGTYAIGPPPPAPVAALPEKLELEQKVLFATGQVAIHSSSEPELDVVAEELNEHPEVERVLIAGHADAQGSAAANERISRERAEAVRVYLIQKGVEPDRLEAQGFGASRPLADNATPDGREANRRVEFVVVAPKPTRVEETGTGSSVETGPASQPPSR
jgi:outer membrane protein OmpA-like peptidoglycan-associated protein